MSYIPVTLGADPSKPFGIGYAGYETWLAWTREVAGRGGLATSMPAQAGKYEGMQAERYPAAVIAARRFPQPMVWTSGNQFGYYLAPKRILALDTLHQAHMKMAIAEGKVAEGLENAAKSVLGGAVITAAIGAGLLYLLTRSGPRP